MDNPFNRDISYYGFIKPNCRYYYIFCPIKIFLLTIFAILILFNVKALRSF